jgi:hypothetical protein
MFPLPPRPMDIRCGGATIGCSPVLPLLDVMASYYKVVFCVLNDSDGLCVWYPCPIRVFDLQAVL